MTTIILNTGDVIATIKAKLPEYREHDARILAAHKAAEEQKAADYIAACKEIGKLTPTGLRRKHAAKVKATGNRWTEIGPKRYPGEDTCPRSLEQRAKKTLKVLAITRQTKWTLSPGGANDDIYRLVTFELDPEPEGLCS